MLVRAAVLLAAAIGPALAGAGAASAQVPGEQPAVSVVIVPRGTTPSGLAAESPKISPGIMSAGLGSVPPDQTYLDISQGNRVFNSLYADPIPPLVVRSSGVPPGPWARQLQRAAEAPAEIDPGLLTAELRRAGVPVGALPRIGDPALIATGPDGRLERRRDCAIGRCPGLLVGKADSSELGRLIARLRGDDLLIAIERPPPLGRVLSIGIAGRGFEGTNLASPTTRIDGYVLSTDIAPTILDRFGLPVPDQMSGRVIDGAADRDVGGLAALDQRMGEVADRRSPVLGVNLILWLLLTALAALALGGAAARIALSALAVALAWVPALLLLTAALEPSVLVERLIAGLGGPLLALGSIRLLRGAFTERAAYAAFALAAAVAVSTTALDMIAGSPLTSVSLLGPNPALGVRFYGIGNELEAAIGVLLALGSGAAVAALQPADPRRAVALTASTAALLGVLVFAPGRFGADVGAAITFPAGADGVVIAAFGVTRRRLALAAGIPLAALAAVVGIDLLSGGDAHLSRSLLAVDSLDQLGQVVERRVRPAVRSFERVLESPFYAAALTLIVVAILRWRAILDWFAGRPAARAGFIGGAAASVIGALANDSGVLLLMVGAAYLAAFAGLAWATGSPGANASDRKARLPEPG